MNQKGFSHLIILVTVIVIGLVSLSGWFVYKKKDEPKNQQPTTRQTAQQSQSQEDTNQQPPVNARKTFDCKGIFSVKYPDSWQASMHTSDPPQCLIANVKTSELPPVGSPAPNQLALFFNTEKTSFASNKDYLNDYATKAQQDSTFQLKSQEELKLDNGKSAILALVYGGHSAKRDYYFFVYLKNGTAITTSFEANTTHKDAALAVLKSVQ